MYKNYNMNQLVLPINLEVKLQENEIGFALMANTPPLMIKRTKI